MIFYFLIHQLFISCKIWSSRVVKWRELQQGNVNLLHRSGESGAIVEPFTFGAIFTAGCGAVVVHTLLYRITLATNFLESSGLELPRASVDANV